MHVIMLSRRCHSTVYKSFKKLKTSWSEKLVHLLSGSILKSLNMPAISSLSLLLPSVQSSCC